VPYVYRANRDFVICYLDSAARLLLKGSVPTVRLYAPGSDEGAVFHHNNPDTDEAVLAVTGPDTQTFTLPEKSQESQVHRFWASCWQLLPGITSESPVIRDRIEEYREIVIINRGCFGLVTMRWRKEGLNGFLQVASAEPPILDCAYEPLRVGLGIAR